MQEEDIYIRYLREYHKEHGTINNIPFKYTVVFEDTTLFVYEFLKNIRNRHRAYIGESKPMSGYKSKKSLSRYQALDEMGYDWNSNSRKTKDSVQTEIEVRFLRDHYQKYGTINDIPYGAEVEFEGKILKIGSYLKVLRERHVHYVKGESTRYANSEIFVARYQILDEMNFDWKPNQRLADKQAKNDICLRYLRKYYEEHGTIADITSKTVDKFEGEIIEIGRFLEQTRFEYRKYNSGNRKDACASSVMLERYKALDEMKFIWEPQAYKLDNYSEIDPFIQYLRKHYQEHGTINDIKADTVVEFNDEILNIGDFLSKMRYNYSRHINGDKRRNYSSKLLLQRYEILKELEFDFNPEKKATIKQVAENYGISVASLSKLYRKFDNDLEKALKIALVRKEFETRKKEQEEQITLDNLLTIFEIDFAMLESYLTRSFGKRDSLADPAMYQNISLKEFCTRNSYNYEVLIRAIKLKQKIGCNESFESLVNRSIIELSKSGQNRPSNWIYTKYGNEILVKHMMLFIGFNSANILKDMSKDVLTLDEAFAKESFKRFSSNKYPYLEGVYQDYIDFYHELLEENDDEKITQEKMVEKAQGIIDYFNLTMEEFSVIRQAFFTYTDAIYKFHLCDVGFEKDNEKRIEKIIAYKLDTDDIEEAFFIPLKFEQKVLIGRDSELYHRRTIVKNLTVSWNDLTEEEQVAKQKQHKLTQEELHYIKETRKTIDETKAKVLEKI